MAETLAIEPQIPHPDTINPQSPPETPAQPTPNEAPGREPPEVSPTSPDIDEPGRGPDEMPATDGEPDGLDPDHGDPDDRVNPSVGQGGILQSNLDGPIGSSVE